MEIPGRLFAAFALSLAAGVVAAQGHSPQGHSPYAGQHARQLKALSDDEVRQLLEGAGMGYARAAELNGYPGPMHVLELADKLGLSAQQREETRRLMDLRLFSTERGWIRPSWSTP